ncbi:MAG: GTP cyclohydrolase II [Candidatus Altiarchaeota archaeon]
MERLKEIIESEKIGPFRLPSQLQDGSVEEFKLYYFHIAGESYYVLEKGEQNGKDDVLVRISSACSFAHIFHSLRCDCKQQLDAAMKKIAKNGGLLIYAFNQEGRSIGFANHVRSYMKQDEGFDTVDSYLELGLPVDEREYTLCSLILKDLHIKKIRLLTNNPEKVESLEKEGLIVKRVPLIAELSPFNESQMKVKKEKLGHMIY